MTPEQKQAIAIATARARLNAGQAVEQPTREMSGPPVAPKTPQAPEGWVFDPNSGAMVGPEYFKATSSPSTGTAAMQGLGQGVTFGGMDEIVSGIMGMAGKGSFQENYDLEKARQKAQLEMSREEHPYVTGGSELAGAVATGAGLGPAVKAGSTLGKMGQAALIGGGEGALYGGLSSEGGGRLGGAAKGGAMGAAAGGGLSLAGSGVGAIADKLRTSKAANKMIAATPSGDSLKASAGDLYDEAQRTGVTASKWDTLQFADDIDMMARGEGLVTPKGRMAKGTPNVSDAINLIDDYAGEAMQPVQMKSVRKALQRAAGSKDGSEARIGTAMIKRFDDFTSPLTPTIKEANSLYSSAMRGEVIDQAVELAGSQAGQFTGSGFENALRTQFRALDRQIIKGTLKGLSPEQIASIKRVANGGPLENISRNVGKAAPTGVVSAGMGGGMPFLVGNAVGGPAVGAAMGGGTLAAGALGRKAATSMQKKNAAIAAALMRGGKMPNVQKVNLPLSAGRGNAGNSALIASLLAGQGPR